MCILYYVDVILLFRFVFWIIFVEYIDKGVFELFVYGVVEYKVD